jgi:hypothetical protein
MLPERETKHIGTSYPKTSKSTLASHSPFYKRETSSPKAIQMGRTRPQKLSRLAWLTTCHLKRRAKWWHNVIVGPTTPVPFIQKITWSSVCDFVIQGYLLDGPPFKVGEIILDVLIVWVPPPPQSWRGGCQDVSTCFRNVALQYSRPWSHFPTLKGWHIQPVPLYDKVANTTLGYFLIKCDRGGLLKLFWDQKTYMTIGVYTSMRHLVWNTFLVKCDQTCRT